jgi:hypothetical protein
MNRLPSTTAVMPMSSRKAVASTCRPRHVSLARYCRGAFAERLPAIKWHVNSCNPRVKIELPKQSLSELRW